MLNIQVLSDRSSILVQVFTSECRDALEQMLEAQVGILSCKTSRLELNLFLILRLWSGLPIMWHLVDLILFCIPAREKV